jgi:hypothetical protein
VTAVEPAPVLADEDGLPAAEGLPLQPEQINEATYRAWISRYGVPGVLPPPARTISIGVAVGLEEEAGGGSGGDQDNSKAKTIEPGVLSVPEQYVATDMEVAIASEYDDASRFYDIKIGAATIKREPHYYSTQGLRPVGMSGNIPVSLLAKNYENLVVNIVLECTLTDRALEVWQIQTYEAILAEYRRQLAEYRDQIAGARLEESVTGLAGTHPLTLEEFARTEVKRSALMAITGQTFDLFDAIREGDGGAPTEFSYPDVVEEGSYIQFLEQGFEWGAMGYVLYPYFWGRKDDWGGVAFQEHNDPLFARFLRAGSARVVVPVRPGWEDAIRFFLDTGRPWLGGSPPVIGEVPSGADDSPTPPPFIHVAEELREQLGVDFRDGEGRIGATAGGVTVDLSDALVDVEWLDRKIRIEAVVYRIREVADDAQTARLDRPFEGDTGEHPFAVGPRVVGAPWETRLPTTLVALDGEVGELPVVENG